MNSVPWGEIDNDSAFIMTSSNGNIFRVNGPLWGESTGHRWFPLTKASDAELWNKESKCNLFNGRSRRRMIFKCISPKEYYYVIGIKISMKFVPWGEIDNKPAFMMASSDGNVFRVIDPLWWESTGHLWIPLTMARDVELWCFLDLRLNKRLSKQSIWDAIASLWRHYNVFKWCLGIEQATRH